LNSRTLICTLAGLVAVIILVALTPRLTFSPQGITLLLQQAPRASISPNDVVIYEQEPSVNFTRLAHISVEQAYRTLNDNTKEMLTQKIKDMAAKIGANGVIVSLIVPSNQLHQMIIFRGTAIYIPSAATGSKQ
jgi:hypothetical protein